METSIYWLKIFKYCLIYFFGFFWNYGFIFNIPVEVDVVMVLIVVAMFEDDVITSVDESS